MGGRVITVRRLDPDLSDMPRWWYADDPVLTHTTNAVNLLFPEGERYFIRAVRRYEARLPDELRGRVRHFCGQEANHGRSHELQVAVMEAQGLEISSWLAWYRRVAFGWLEPVTPPRLRLSMTVALEHITASSAAIALQNRFLDEAHPGMRELLLWHAAEEIEHRSVAFDVYAAVGGGWGLRVLGLVCALLGVSFFWWSANRHLMRQEPTVGRAQIQASTARQRAVGQDRSRALRRALLDYLHPRFHPSQADIDDLAEAWLGQPAQAR